MSTTTRMTKQRPAQALTISGLSVWVEGRPISVNMAYGNRRGGHGKYLKPEARAWSDFVWIAFRIQSHIFAPEQLPLRVHCTFYGVRGDADNYLKLTLDGIKRAIGIDDRHFSPVTAEVVRKRNAGQQGARIEVWAADSVPAGLRGAA